MPLTPLRRGHGKIKTLKEMAQLRLSAVFARLLHSLPPSLVCLALRYFQEKNNNPEPNWGPRTLRRWREKRRRTRTTTRATNKEKDYEYFEGGEEIRKLNNKCHCGMWPLPCGSGRRRAPPEWTLSLSLSKLIHLQYKSSSSSFYKNKWYDEEEYNRIRR